MSFFTFIKDSIKKVKTNSHDALDIKLIKNLQRNKIPNLGQIKYLHRYFTFGEKRAIKLSFTAIIIVLIIWSGAALARHIEIAPKQGGTYTEGVVGSPAHINPMYAPTNNADADLVRIIYSGLMKVDHNGDIVADLAESYKINEKQNEYIFELKKNVKWHDGAVFSADDILFTFEMIKDPQTASPMRPAFQGVRVEKIDDYSVRFVLERPFAPFITSLTTGIIPQHIWEGIDPQSISLSGLNMKPVGTGPFAFEQLIREADGLISRISLKRNNDFYGEKPYLERVNMVFYDASEAAVGDLIQQKVDGINFLPFSTRESAAKQFLNTNLLTLPQYTGIFFNQKLNESLKELAVRKAIMLAIDKNEIAAKVLDTEGIALAGPIAKNSFGYDETLAQISKNIDSAKQELTSAKWEPLDKNGYIMLKSAVLHKLIQQNATSTPGTTVPSIEEIKTDIAKDVHPAQSLFWKKGNRTLEIEITTANTPQLVEASSILAAQLIEAGIVTRLKFLEPSAIIREAIRGRDYETLVFGQIIGVDADLFPFWHSSQNEYPGLNLSVYTDRDIDNLLVTTREAIKVSDRIDAYKKLQKLFLERIPAVFLYEEPYRYVTNKRVRGMKVKTINSPSDRLGDIGARFVRTKWKWK